MEEATEAAWSYRAEWLSDSRLRLTMSSADIVRWHSQLLLGADATLLVDPWPWPHVDRMTELLQREVPGAAPSDLLIQSPHPLVYSSLSSLTASVAQLRVWCTPRIARYFPQHEERAGIVAVTGPTARIELTAESAVRLLHGETESGIQVLLAVDELNGYLLAPGDWKLYTTTTLHGERHQERPATPAAIARHFGLDTVLYTHEVHDEGAEELTHSEVSEAGEPGDRCPITKLLRGETAEAELLEHLRAHGEQAWLYFVGVDNMESINATYGREYGDQALYAVSQALRQVKVPAASGPPGALYRLEGPLFLYLWSGELAEALEVAEEIRKRVAESASFLETLTVSVGVVAGDEVDFGESGDSPSVDDADQRGLARLRIARNSGGNTVCVLSPEVDESGFSTGTILVIDPEVERLGALIRELEAMGMSVIQATDGLEALQIAHQIVPDVIVTEISVPKLDGFGLRRRLRQSSEFGRVPFVLISHRKNDELVQEAAGLGILYYFQKPISTVELTGLLRNLALKE